MVANYTLANELHHVLSMRAVSTKDELGPPSLEVLVTYFSAHVYTKQLLVALLTWVLYEILITTGESVELFWKQRWNLSKSLFFINQYVGLFATTVNAFQYFAYHPSSQFCSVMPWLGLVGSFIIVSVMGLAMLLRVIALWNRSRLVKMVTILLFLVYILHFIVFAVYGYTKGEIVPLEISPYTGCSFNLDHRLPLYTIFISPLIFYTFIVAFTILKSYPLLAYKSKSTDGAIFRLSSVLVNDGVVYYIALIISQVISLYAAITLDADPTVVIPIVRAAPGIAVTIVACNRLFLRLHDVMLMREDEGNLARRVPNRDGKGMGTTVVSARVSAFAPMDQSIDGSRGNRDGDIPLQHPMTTNDAQLNDQLATVDYDYHAYLRKGLNHERTPSR